MRHDPIVMRAMLQRRETELASASRSRRRRPKLWLRRLTLALLAGWLARGSL